MGVATDAILCFGFDLGETEPWTGYYADEYDLGEYLLTRAGEPNSWQSTMDPDGEREWREWLDRKQEAKDNAPIEIVQHGSGNFPEYIVAIKGTVTTASRGYPKIIDGLVTPPAEMWQRVAEFCVGAAIEWPNADGAAPRWLLASWWC